MPVCKQLSKVPVLWQNRAVLAACLPLLVVFSFAFLLAFARVCRAFSVLCYAGRSSANAEWLHCACPSATVPVVYLPAASKVCGGSSLLAFRAVQPQSGELIESPAASCACPLVHSFVVPAVPHRTCAESAPVSPASGCKGSRCGYPVDVTGNAGVSFCPLDLRVALRLFNCGVAVMASL